MRVVARLQDHFGTKKYFIGVGPHEAVVHYKQVADNLVSAECLDDCAQPLAAQAGEPTAPPLSDPMPQRVEGRQHDQRERRGRDDAPNHDDREGAFDLRSVQAQHEQSKDRCGERQYKTERPIAGTRLPRRSKQVARKSYQPTRAHRGGAQVGIDSALTVRLRQREAARDFLPLLPRYFAVPGTETTTPLARRRQRAHFRCQRTVRE